MKLRAGFVLRQIGSHYVVFPVGNHINKNILIELNETGAFLWNLLSAGALREELLSAMIGTYDIERCAAMDDLNYFIDMCYENNLLEEL